MSASTHSRRRCRSAGVATVLAVTLLSATAVHAAPTSKLTYVRGPGAETCPAEPELRAAVSRRVGYDPFFPYADRTVVAQIDHTPRGFTALIRIVDGAGQLLGERSIPSLSNCAELVQSLALTISVAIDDLDAATAPAPAPETEPARATPPDPPARTPEVVASSEHAPPVTPTAPVRAVHGRASLGAVTSLGAAPAPALGVAPAASLRGEWWQLGLEGRFDAPASSDVARGGAISTSLALGAVVPCVLAAGAITPYACGEVALGSFHGESTNVTQPGSSSALYAALGGRVGAEIAVAGRLAAYLQLDAAAPTARHRLELGGSTVYALPAIWVAIGLGVSVLVF